MSREPAELAELRRRAREISDLNGIGGLLLWDQNTMMPPGGAGARADQFEALERIQHDRLTDPGLAEAARRARAVGGVRRSGLRRRQPRPRPAARPPQGGAGPDRAGGGDLRAPPRTPSSPGWRRARRATSSTSRPRSSACSSSRAATSRASTARASSRTRTTSCSTTTSRASPREELQGIFAACRRSSCRSCPPPRPPARTATCSRGTSRVEAQQRMADELLHAVGFETEHWRLDAVRPSLRAQHGRHRRAADDALGGGRPGDGVLLLPARVRARALRGAVRAAPLPDDAGGGHRARRARVAVAAVGEPRGPLAAVLRVGAAAAAAPSRRAVRDAGRGRAVPRRQPGPALADPDRGRRDDLQPPHRAALRARAGAGRGPAQRRRAARTPGTRRRTGCSASRSRA